MKWRVIVARCQPDRSGRLDPVDILAVLTLTQISPQSITEMLAANAWNINVESVRFVGMYAE